MLVRSPPAALARDGGQCTGSWDDGAGATGTLRTRRTSALTVISVADQSGPSRVLCPDSTCRQDGAHLLEVEQVLGTHGLAAGQCRSEEQTSELQSLMRLSYAVFCLKK